MRTANKAEALIANDLHNNTAVDIKKLSDLTPDSRNANRGSERGNQMIEDSLRQYGAANTQGNTPYVPKLTPEMEARKWKPGESGNLSGRPKRKPLTDAYAALLDKPIPPDMARQLKLDESTTYAQVIAMSLVREAVKGKVNAAAEVADRVEGKITQPISGPDEGPIQIKIDREAAIAKLIPD